MAGNSEWSPAKYVCCQDTEIVFYVLSLNRRSLGNSSNTMRQQRRKHGPKHGTLHHRKTKECRMQNTACLIERLDKGTSAVARQNTETRDEESW